MKHPVSLKIGGQAGQGIKTSGYILTKALKNLGCWTFSYSEYPSLIRGAGHSTFQINISDTKINSVTQQIDILVALNEETITLHHEEINKGGFLVSGEKIKIKPRIKKALDKRKITIIKVPLEKIVQENKGIPVMQNSVITGATWTLLTSEYKQLEEQIKKIFGQKSKDIKTNLKCARDGYNFVETQNIAPASWELKPKKGEDRIIGTGNEVAGLAIYASGCRLYCAYPMTPSTGILHYLAPRSPKMGMVVKQAEDEITTIQMVVGANYAGTRATCATSGGGLALMAETLSLVGMSETPLVVFNSQRPAPATGVPTWTEQGDLDFVSKIGHGEFPRIIIAPGDIDEVFSLVPQAFNLSEKYQTLVIVLLDKYLSESWYQTEQFKDSKIKVQRGQTLSETDLIRQVEYGRYKHTVSGVSPRSFPGMRKGIFLANSDEHDEKGYSTEDQETRKLMLEKRMRKLTGITADLPEPKLYGPKNAKSTVICWGSQKGPILDAIEEVNAQKAKVNVLHYSFVYPLKDGKLKRLAKKNKLLAIENNYSAQLAKLIKAESGVDIQTRITKYVGTPFFRDELVDILKNKV